ncbi:MAG: hypothetical protein HQK53_11990 [Oligoflexia bacterium]|nr:hypothetical protein [Oligoflexia bacterium]
MPLLRCLGVRLKEEILREKAALKILVDSGPLAEITKENLSPEEKAQMVIKNL